jgi:probable HAF family extracellular repeat protein
MLKHWKRALTLLCVAASAALVYCDMALGGGGKQPPTTPQPQYKYQIQFLGKDTWYDTMYPGQSNSHPEAVHINNNGWIVGATWATVPTDLGNWTRAFIVVPWTDTTAGQTTWYYDNGIGANSLFVALDDLAAAAKASGLLTNLPDGVHFRNALAINDQGQIVGQINTNGDANTARAFRCTISRLWTTPASGTPNALGLCMTEFIDFGPGTYQAWGINSSGDVAGDNRSAIAGVGGFLFTATTGLTESVPNTLGGNSFWMVHGLNDSRRVVGCASDSLGRRRAFSYTPSSNVLVDLGDFGFYGANYLCDSYSYAINNQNHIVGEAGNLKKVSGFDIHHAFLYTDQNGLQDLGICAGDMFSSAKSINSADEIVGTSGTYQPKTTVHGYIYTYIKGSNVKKMFNLEHWIVGNSPQNPYPKYFSPMCITDPIASLGGGMICAITHVTVNGTNQVINDSCVLIPILNQ